MSNRFDKLSETLNLPKINEVLSTDEPSQEDIKAALSATSDLEKTLKNVNGFDQHDQEMDELADLAMQAHKDLMDLGMNVEVKHAGEIFSSASSILKTAVEAKHNKVEKKLKLLKLQLDKLKIDKMSEKDDPEEGKIDGDTFIIDRNDLLQKIKNAK